MAKKVFFLLGIPALIGSQIGLPLLLIIRESFCPPLPKGESPLKTHWRYPRTTACGELFQLFNVAATNHHVIQFQCRDQAGY